VGAARHNSGRERAAPWPDDAGLFDVGVQHVGDGAVAVRGFVPHAHAR
jgi:hypothetical protein